jgi:hypothetical protein
MPKEPPERPNDLRHDLRHIVPFGVNPVVDDLGVRKLPHTAAEDLLGMTLRASLYAAHLESIRGGLGKLLGDTARQALLLGTQPKRRPVDAGGKRRHPRAHGNTGVGADEPEA